MRSGDYPGLHGSALRVSCLPGLASLKESLSVSKPSMRHKCRYDDFCTTEIISGSARRRFYFVIFLTTSL